jgi:threonyl-tRNA synthetase
MKLLLLHSDYLAYEVKKKTRVAEEIPEEMQRQRAEEVLVAFLAVERGDESDVPSVVERGVGEIEKVFREVKAKSVMLYPYAHLSSNLARPKTAVEVLKAMEAALRERLDGEVKRAPFGYYKAFELRCKGHPLSELSREITVEPEKEREGEEVSEAVQAEARLTSRWFVLLPDGERLPAGEYDFSQDPELETLYRYETSGTREGGREPPHIRLMLEHELVDYEPGSDSGNLRWYPRGALIKHLLERHVSETLRRYGVMEVETPIMYDFDHPNLKKYLHRFPAKQYVLRSDEKEYFLRFAACFGQYLMAHDMTISYRNLPLRLYELTHYSFRREKTGELSGLKRLRTFTMPDLHTLCRDMDQAKEEFYNQYRLSMEWMKDLGLDYQVVIRFVREFYEENEDFAKELARLIGRPILIELWEERFFYFVMKFEFSVNDALEKAATLSTVQIDVENTERFGITYVDEDGERKHPLMLHASISGGIERNLYALLERAWLRSQKGEKPMLPLWLSPTQVRLIPVSEEQLAYGEALCRELNAQGVRADLDDENDTLQKKIRRAEKEWTPYIAVVGEREVKSGRLSVRVRGEKGGGRQREITLEELIERIRKETEGTPKRGLPLPHRLARRPKFR